MIKLRRAHHDALDRAALEVFVERAAAHLNMPSDVVEGGIECARDVGITSERGIIEFLQLAPTYSRALREILADGSLDEAAKLDALRASR